VLDDLKFEHTWIFAQGFPSQDDRFSLALGLDHHRAGLHLSLLLGETSARCLLLLDHLGFDGIFQGVGQSDVFQDEILDYENIAHFLACALECLAFHFLAFLHDHLGGAHGGEFVECFGNPRLDEGVEFISCVITVQRHHRGFRNAEEHSDIDFHLLEVGGIAICLHLGSLLPNELGDNPCNEG